MLDPQKPALILAPMDGVTDAPMRAVLSRAGGFAYAVSEFLRVSSEVIPRKVFFRDVPELWYGGCTPSGLPVQVQILGGDPDRMAISAVTAVAAGAQAIDINFGCPAPTVNRHDGGASLLNHPLRIREIVSAVRQAVPPGIPVSAKLRLGWDSIDAIDVNAEMAAQGGASWLTIHGRTKTQNYAPPAYWTPIGRVRARLDIPVIANGDIWSLDDFHRCQDQTNCRHFMLGRGALADPRLPRRIAHSLGLIPNPPTSAPITGVEWCALLQLLLESIQFYSERMPVTSIANFALQRSKQWLHMSARFGSFRHFETLKRSATLDELFQKLRDLDSKCSEDEISSKLVSVIS